ncbi:MAG: recombination regulator RecX [Alicyclobacillus sp.]|nr:recombination regulator RecX [Alicyclobacillus sp.]
MTTEASTFRDQITGRVEVPGRPYAMEIRFEHHDALVIRLQTWLDLDLKIGTQVDADLMDQLVLEATKLHFLDIAARFVRVRPRTEQELVQHLLRKGIPDEILQAVMEDSKRQAWVNDQLYAKVYLDQKAGRMSRRAIAHRLRQRGVADELVTPLLSQEDVVQEEHRAALAAAKKYWRQHRVDEPAKRRLKLMRYLAQHGYPAGLVRAVAREVAQDTESTTEP